MYAAQQEQAAQGGAEGPQAEGETVEEEVTDVDFEEVK